MKRRREQECVESHCGRHILEVLGALLHVRELVEPFGRQLQHFGAAIQREHAVTLSGEPDGGFAGAAADLQKHGCGLEFGEC
ncbi:MAG: hypothetical protein ABIP66_15655, partial [Gemmatimonadaceae bacterium]